MKAIYRSASAAIVMAGCAALLPATAWAEPDPTSPEPTSEPQPVAQIAPDDQLHNVTYRARVDGVARGALITYKINDTQVQSVDPTMLPGRTFEAQTVLDDADLAGMQVSIQWPYSANLHCEILVDDAIVAKADQFIKPRLTPADDDPDYGKLLCGAPLISPAGLGPAPETGNVVNTDAVEAPVSDSAEPAPEGPPAA